MGTLQIITCIMMGTLSDKYIITAIGFRLAKVSEQKGDQK